MSIGSTKVKKGKDGKQKKIPVQLMVEKAL